MNYFQLLKNFLAVFEIENMCSYEIFHLVVSNILLEIVISFLNFGYKKLLFN